ncbi:hypothetical protein GOP47_0022766 [Adiantum capillus-veneris]|uniref:PRLI-interacting factor A n=1 Tax=Adiantum capillus-veneris TaxID=13818 RepID=A0A9D4Z6B3_ADICA|nr:hypothetical protein GOP47_0022766 [Adiantum capillus-veneris]
MGFSAPSDSLQAGNLDNKGFRKPKRLNMNNNSKKVIKKKNKNKKWKNAKPSKNSGLAMLNPSNNGMAMGNPNQTPLGMVSTSQNAMGMVNPSNNVLPMAVPRFVVPALPQSMSYALQRPPIDRYFVMNPSLVDTRFKGYNHGMVPRNAPKKRRILSKRKMTSPFLHAPLAPRNTTSFIMRAKKLGGIAPAVTPSPATPAVFPTPLLSPGVRDKGSLEEMNRELGVDGYGSMNGLIRLRSYEDRARDGSESESDVEQGDLMNEEHSVHSVERLEQRIDQGLSRFEMIYPSRSVEMDGAPPRNLQNCVISQERLIAHLEEENLTLKERLFLVEQELIELRRRVRELEGLNVADEPKEEQCEESCGDVSTPCK